MSQTISQTQEQLVCLPTLALQMVDLLEPGFTPCDGAIMGRLHRLLGVGGVLIPRDQAEQDESFRQIVTYDVLLCRDELTPTSAPSVYRYYRTKKAGEERLRGKASIGVGGHVSRTAAEAEQLPIREPGLPMAGRRIAFARPGEVLGLTDEQERHVILTLAKDAAVLLQNASARELAEEVQLSGALRDAAVPVPQYRGLINDESNPVGRVHLGVVNCFRVHGELRHAEEDGLTGGEFVSLDQLRAEFDQFESWSQLLIDHLWKTIG